MAQRTGSARIFFEVVGSFQAARLLKDAEATGVVMKAIMLDAFGGVAEAIQNTFEGIADIIQEQMEAFYAFEEQLIQVRKFYQGDEQEIKTYTEASKKLGETFAFSGAEALKAAAQMAQMKTVLGESQAVIAGTEMGLLFAEIGNMDTQMAMKRLTSLMQQTHFALGGMTQAQYEQLDAETQANVVRSNTIRVLDQLNTIENSSVATMEDMTFVLNQFSSQGHLAGETMGDMAALAAMLLEAGEEASRAGTGLRMIYSRLGRQGGDAAVAIAEAVPHLTDTEVSMMSLTEVINELAPSYALMTDIEKQRLSQSIGGYRHYVKFQKLMENHLRLNQLQEMAYTGVYSAISEFENRQVSNLFVMERAEATLENMRVEVGENLAQAYVRAMGPQYTFLKMMRNLSDEQHWTNKELKLGVFHMDNMAKSALANIMHMTNMMEAMRVPLDFGLGLLNIIISMKTLAVVARATDPMAGVRTEAFGRMMRAREQEIQLKQQSISLNQVEVSQIKENMRAEISRSTMLVNRHNMDHTVHRTKMSWHAELMAAGKAYQANQTQANMDRLTALMNEGALTTMSLATLEREKALHMETYALFKLRADGAAIYWNQSISARQSQQKDMAAYLSAVKSEVNYLAKEYMLYVELNKETLERLALRLEEVNVNIATAVSQKEILHQKRAELLADGKSTVAIDKKIAAKEKEILAMGQERVAIEQTVRASEQAKLRKDAEAASSAKMGAILWAEIGTRKALIGVMQKGMKTAGSLLGVYMMFADTEEEMRAAMIGMGVAWVTAAAMAKIYETELDMIAIKQAVVTGGLSLLVGVVAGFLAYKAGDALSDRLAGGSFSDEMSKIHDLNSTVQDFYGTMTDLSSLGEEMVYPELGDWTYNQLRMSEEAAREAAATIGASIATIDDALNDPNANLSESEELFLANQRAFAEERLKQVQTIIDSHEILAGSYEDTAATIADAAAMTIVDMGPTEEEAKYARIWSDDPEVIARFTAWQKGFYEVRDSAGGVITTFVELADAEAYVAEQAEKNVDTLEDTAIAMRNVAGGILEPYVEEVYDTIGAVGEQMEQLEKFSDAREELFFGQKSNWSGAIYRKVIQGGVESLLHRVDIMVTNNFHGLTMDEAVDEIGNRIVGQLRLSGVPVSGYST